MKEYLKKHYCIDCRKGICYSAWKYGQGRCRSCSKKGELNCSFGRKINRPTKEKPKCIDCSKTLSTYKSKRCVLCNNKILGIKRRKIKIYPKCLICEKTLSASHCKYCKSCIQRIKMLKNWKDINFRNKIIRASMKSRKLKPNNVEKELRKLLNKILYKQYKYVGDGEIIIGGFNPDFINCNGQKKIIELFGDYWHNREDAKQRDKLRLKTYVKYGYKTLIIWEKELKNLNKLKQKILEFHNE